MEGEGGERIKSPPNAAKRPTIRTASISSPSSSPAARRKKHSLAKDSAVQLKRRSVAGPGQRHLSLAGGPNPGASSPTGGRRKSLAAPEADRSLSESPRRHSRAQLMSSESPRKHSRAQLLTSESPRRHSRAQVVAPNEEQGGGGVVSASPKGGGIVSQAVAAVTEGSAEHAAERRRVKQEAVKRLSKVLQQQRTISSGVTSFEDKIDLEQLKALKELFDEADEDGGGDLDQNEFTKAFSQILGDLHDDVLREWFMRIDANANGSVDWDEFSTYILLEGQQRILKDTVQAEYIEQRAACPQKGQLHTDMITQIVVHPRIDRYYTCSRDGMVKAWRASTLEHERVLYNGSAWVTDACLMKGGMRLLLACADRKLIVLDSNTGEMHRVFAGRKHVRHEVRETVTVRRLNDRRKYGVALDMEKSWGDSALAGNRHNAEQLCEAGFGEFSQVMEESQREKATNKTVEVTTLKELTEAPTALEHFCSESDQQSVLLGLRDGAILLYHLTGALSGSRPLVHLAHRYAGHSQRHVRGTNGCAISRLALSRHLQCVISGSWDGTVRLTKLEDGKMFQELRGHQSSVYSLDWSEQLKIIATCGTERHVHIWNPFISKPVFRLQGMTASLVHVRMNERDHQIITLSSDKCIKVWDVRTFRCMQTIVNNAVYSPENTLLALAVDPVRHTIITGATSPVVWPMRKQATKFCATYTGHSRATVGCMVTYFNHAVSADSELVYVWEIETGNRVFAFNASRTMADQSNLPPDQARVTAIAMDESRRRLLTGIHNGYVMMWNYVNGQPLNIFTPVSREAAARGEVRAVQAIVHHVDEDRDSHGECQVRSVLICSGNALLLYPDGDQYTVKRTGEYQQFDTTGQHAAQVKPKRHSDPSPTAGVSPASKSLPGTLSPRSAPFSITPNSTAANRGSPRPSRRDDGRLPVDITAAVPVGRMVALGLESGAVQMYNTNTNKSAGRTMSVVYSPQADGLLKRGGAQIGRARAAAPVRRIEALAYLDTKESVLVTASSDGYLEFWNVRTRVLLHMLPCSSGDVIPCALATDKDDSRLLLGSDDGVITVYDIDCIDSDAHEIPADDVVLLRAFQAHKERVTGLQWVQPYSLILSSSTDCSVSLHSEQGLYIGWFGLHDWDISKKHTWQGTEPAAVKQPISQPRLLPEVPDCSASSQLGGPGANRSGLSTGRKSPNSAQLPSLPAVQGGGRNLVGKTPHGEHLSPVSVPSARPAPPAESPPCSLPATGPRPRHSASSACGGETFSARLPSRSAPFPALALGGTHHARLSTKAPLPLGVHGARSSPVPGRPASPPRHYVTMRQTGRYGGPKPPAPTPPVALPVEGTALLPPPLSPSPSPRFLVPSPPPTARTAPAAQPAAEAEATRTQTAGPDGTMDPRPRRLGLEDRDFFSRRLEEEAEQLLQRRCDPFHFPRQTAAGRRARQKAQRRREEPAPAAAVELPPQGDPEQTPATLSEQHRPAPGPTPPAQTPVPPILPDSRLEDSQIEAPQRRHPGEMSVAELDRRIAQLYSLGYDPANSRTARDRQRKREEVEKQRKFGGGRLSSRSAPPAEGGGAQGVPGEQRFGWSSLPCSVPRNAKLRKFDEPRGGGVLMKNPRSCPVCADAELDEGRARPRAAMDGHQAASLIGWSSAEIFRDAVAAEVKTVVCSD
eukprot:TRINITY_DN8152_c0_g1_i2.p1 TRINITY_DN8152_c0_g1~~TRINITY_DN8152_c0_g1_i2.p1  ORF type:complete len:1695 (+),score=441.43 TRINITY_DN8152_c0_g1_i2:95-5086(+)